MLQYFWWKETWDRAIIYDHDQTKVTKLQRYPGLELSSIVFEYEIEILYSLLRNLLYLNAKLKNHMLFLGGPFSRIEICMKEIITAEQTIRTQFVQVCSTNLQIFILKNMENVALFFFWKLQQCTLYTQYIYRD